MDKQEDIFVTVKKEDIMRLKKQNQQMLEALIYFVKRVR